MGGGQPFPFLGDVGGLLGGLRFLDGADKLGTIIFGILRDSPEHIGNQSQNSFGLDTVLCRAKRADRVLTLYSGNVIGFDIGGLDMTFEVSEDTADYLNGYFE